MNKFFSFHRPITTRIIYKKGLDQNFEWICRLVSKTFVYNYKDYLLMLRTTLDR